MKKTSAATKASNIAIEKRKLEVTRIQNDGIQVGIKWGWNLAMESLRRKDLCVKAPNEAPVIKVQS